MDKYSCMLEKISLKRKWQTWKYLLRKFAKHIVDSTSFTKTVKFSIGICSKMTLIGNYTCSRSILMKNLTCVWRNIYNRELKQVTFLSTRTPTGRKSRRYRWRRMASAVLVWIFHRHMLLRMNLFDKIIKNRCICSFCRHFCIKVQKIIAQGLLLTLPKQFPAGCKQIKIQKNVTIPAKIIII